MLCLNRITKRTACLEYIDSKNIDICLIQESQLTKHSVNSFSNSKYEVVASTTPVLLLVCPGFKVLCCGTGFLMYDYFRKKFNPCGFVFDVV